MDKKSQLLFLKSQLESVERMRLENEVNMRGLNSMNIIGKDNGKMNQAIQGMHIERENLDLKIKHYKILIQEIQDGRFEL